MAPSAAARCLTTSSKPFLYFPQPRHARAFFSNQLSCVNQNGTGAAAPHGHDPADTGMATVMAVGTSGDPQFCPAPLLLLCEVVSDGRPGELLMLLGENLGSNFPEVYCQLMDSTATQQLRTLIRIQRSASTYVTRIPTDLPPGQYTLKMKCDHPNTESSPMALEVLGARSSDAEALLMELMGELEFQPEPVSYTHLRAHETPEHLVCRLLLEKKKKKHH
eukprot:TRINITY_DN7720_c0_g1_i2.p1 TRINITY_DN7720_c0_g1~~TRINITY_DN7720_c0_g1_i2.p1  ORF type:complete len:220 (+),score=55.25 TRINITY_DN7720_c0_g1_i2:323-982(+)